MAGEATGELDPLATREFDLGTVDKVENVLLPAYVKAGDARMVELCERVLAKHGRAVPNHVSGLWSPMEVPRNELQVREMFAHTLPEHGYRIVGSQAEFPDWLLVSDTGEFVYAEVEHRSSAFWTHGHDPTLCDLIVCWEHDWPESPLPVLELFTGTMPVTERTARRKNRGGLSIHFSGNLSRARQVADCTTSHNRREILLATFEEFKAKGYADTRAARAAATAANVNINTARRTLQDAGVLSRRAPVKQGAVVGRVEELMNGGLTPGEAMAKTAEEYGLTRATVASYRSRMKNRS